MPLMPTLRRQSQADLHEFKAGLVYRVSFRIARATQRNPVLKNKNNNKKVIYVYMYIIMYQYLTPSYW